MAVTPATNLVIFDKGKGRRSIDSSFSDTQMSKETSHLVVVVLVKVQQDIVGKIGFRPVIDDRVEKLQKPRMHDEESCVAEFVVFESEDGEDDKLH